MSLLFNHSQITAQNIIYKSEFDHINLDCLREELFISPLKGISFLNRLYDFSQRQLTDIDIYVSPEDLNKLRSILSRHGYKEREEPKWHANAHKICFTKKIAEFEVVIETHTQLTSHKKNDNWNFTKTSHGLKLLPEDEFFYLTYHYAEQHTLLDPKWLKDIYLLLQKENIEVSSLWTTAKKKNLISALIFTSQALNTKYNTDISLPKSFKTFCAQKLVNIKFINQPGHSLWKYLLAKHLVKDGWNNAFLYNIRWLAFLIKNCFTKKN